MQVDVKRSLIYHQYVYHVIKVYGRLIVMF